MAAATLIAGLGAAASIGGAVADRKSAKDSIKSQQNQVEASRAFIDQASSQARKDLFRLFPAAQESRQKGIQAGLNLYGSSIDQQLGALQGGNVAAQQQLIQGLPQIQNAILGNPVNANFQAYNPQNQGLQAPVMPSFGQQPGPVQATGIQSPFRGFR